MPIAAAISATLAAQGQRVVAFKSWDSALADYLKDGDVAVYRQQCEKNTAVFKACSEAVNRCASELQGSAGSLVLRLQGLEQRKLGLTAQLHLLQEQVMLRTAGGGAACDAAHRAHSCSDDEFVVKVAAAVAADEKVQVLRGEARGLQADIEDVCDELRALCCEDSDGDDDADE